MMNLIKVMHTSDVVVKAFSTQVLRFTIVVSLQLQKISTIYFKYSEYYNNQNDFYTFLRGYLLNGVIRISDVLCCV